MLRSHCPSVVAKRTSTSNDENDVSRNSGRKRKKRFDLTEVNDDEDDGDVMSRTLEIEIRQSTGSETKPSYGILTFFSVLEKFLDKYE